MRGRQLAEAFQESRRRWNDRRRLEDDARDFACVPLKRSSTLCESPYENVSDSFWIASGTPLFISVLPMNQSSTLRNGCSRGNATSRGRSRPGRV